MRTIFFRALTLLMVGATLTAFIPTSKQAPPLQEAQADYLSGKTPQDLAWLSNSWHMSKNGYEIWEVWEMQADESLKGTGLTFLGENLLVREHLEIRNIADRLVFIAAVNAKRPVLFTLVEENESGELFFENKEHDSPNRLIYQPLTETSMQVLVQTNAEGEIQQNLLSFTIKEMPEKVQKYLETAPPK